MNENAPKSIALTLNFTADGVTGGGKLRYVVPEQTLNFGGLMVKVYKTSVYVDPGAGPVRVVAPKEEAKRQEAVLNTATATVQKTAKAAKKVRTADGGTQGTPEQSDFDKRLMALVAERGFKLTPA